MRALLHTHRHNTRVEYALPPSTRSAGQARKLTSVFLARAHRRRAPVTVACADDAALVVAELVANAVRHGHGSCLLRLAVSPTHVTVEVHDGNPDGPRVRQAGGGDEHGRGIAIVRALSESLEVIPAPCGGGKALRAILAG
ncbi:ATP-binding protein [Streptomyces sp. BH055]|uniref:ATP-binding protein n=1 Tax=Streptomyces sp. BH055 TaxID=3401173 RepID=UPI003BB622C0